jgi:hypothetical protein
VLRDQRSPRSPWANCRVRHKGLTEVPHQCTHTTCGDIRQDCGLKEKTARKRSSSADHSCAHSNAFIYLMDDLVHACLTDHRSQVDSSAISRCKHAFIALNLYYSPVQAITDLELLYLFGKGINKVIIDVLVYEKTINANA